GRTGSEPFRRPRSGAESAWAAFAQPWLEADPGVPPAPPRSAAPVPPAPPLLPPPGPSQQPPLSPGQGLGPEQGGQGGYPAAGRASVIRASASVASSPPPT